MRVLGIVCDPPVPGRELWADQIRDTTAIGAATLPSALAAMLEPKDVVWSFVNVYDSEEALPDINANAVAEESAPDAIVISGSVYDVTNLSTRPWMASTARWLQDVHATHRIPMLGICFGHQLLCQVFGGAAGVNPNGWELGTHPLSIQLPPPPSSASDPPFSSLFDDLPPTMDVQETHAQSVLTLPPGAVTYGGSLKDPNQLVAYAEFVYGVQYHPEYSASFMRVLHASDEATATASGGVAGSVQEDEWRNISEASPAAVGVVAKFLALAGAVARTRAPQPPSAGNEQQRRSSSKAQRRILAVVCGRPRTNMTPWPTLIRDVAHSEAEASCGADVVAAAALQGASWDVVSIYDCKEALPPVDDMRRGRYDAVIFSGSGYNTTESHAFVDDACRWIRALVLHDGDAAKDSDTKNDDAGALGCGASAAQLPLTVVPMFGICFGHQLLAKALGGRVGFNPRGPQLGTYEVQLAPREALLADPLLRWAASEEGGTATATPWLAQEVHYQSILALPTGATSLATAPKDPHQIVRFASGVYGVQFHPEYPVPYMEVLGDHLPAIREGGEVRANYYASLRTASPQPTSLVSRFLHIAFSGGFTQLANR